MCLNLGFLTLMLHTIGHLLVKNQFYYAHYEICVYTIDNSQDRIRNFGIRTKIITLRELKLKTE
jgi:hypothetical protein